MGGNEGTKGVGRGSKDRERNKEKNHGDRCKATQSLVDLPCYKTKHTGGYGENGGYMENG